MGIYCFDQFLVKVNYIGIKIYVLMYQKQCSVLFIRINNISFCVYKKVCYIFYFFNIFNIVGNSLIYKDRYLIDLLNVILIC